MATERIGIEIEVLGYEQARAKMNQLRNYVTEVGSTKARVDMSDAVKELEANLRRLQATAAQAGRDIVDGIDPKGAKQRLKEANQEMKETRVALNMIKDAMKEIPTKSWGEQFKATMRSVASTTKQAGSAMQTFGRTLQSVTGIGGRVMNGLFMGVGFRLVNTLTSGLSGALERSDTFKTYGKVIKAIMPQLSDEETARGIERLNDAVLGLPTGLDEIVSSQKMFALSTGDYAKAVDLAIASNNAFLASGADAESKNTGERMLNTFLATGKLTAKQWMSLQRTMPSALRAVADDMGYASDQFGAFFNDLKTGEITVDEFVKSFVAVGTSGTISKAVEPMKETFGAILANWQNAIKRLGQNVLDTLSGVLERTTGQNIYQWLLKVKDGIDKVSQSIQNWIKANPQKIKDFFSMLTSIDWFGFLRGIARGLEWVVNFIRQAVGFIGKIFGGSGMESLGKFLIVGNMVGKIITTMGGFIKGLSPVIGAITALIKHAPFGKFFKVIMSPLTKIFGSFKKIGKGFETASPASAFEGATKATTSLANFAKGIAKIGLTAGAGVALVGAMTAISKLAEIMGNTNINWKVAGQNMLFAAGVITAIGGIGYALAGAAPAITVGVAAIGTIATIIGGVVALGTWFFKKGVQNVRTAVEGIRDILLLFKDLKTIATGLNPSDFSMISRAGDIFIYLRQFMTASREDFQTKRGQVRQLAKMMEDMKRVFKSLGKICETINGMQIPTSFNMSRLTEFAKTVNETIDALANKLGLRFGDKGFSAGSSKNLKKIIANMEEVFGSLSHIVSTINGFYAELEKLFHIDEAFNRRTAENGYGSKEWNGKQADEWTYTSIIDYTVQNITQLANVIDTIYETLKREFKPRDKKDAEKVNAIITEMNTTMTSISTIVTTLNTMYKEIENLVVRSGSSSKLGKLSGYITTLAFNLARTFNEINEAFTGQEIVSALDQFAGTNMQAVGTTNTTKNNATSAATIFGKMQEAFASIGQIITFINESATALQTAMVHTKTDASRSPLDFVREYLPKIAQQLRTTFDAINSAFDGMDGSTVESQMQSLDNAFVNIKSIVATINEIGTQFPSDGTVPPAITSVKLAVQELSNMFGGEGGLNGVALATNISVVSVALDQFKTALSEFFTLGTSGGAFDSIRKGLDGILTSAKNLTKYLGENAKNWGTAIVNGFNAPWVVAQIKTALISIAYSIDTTGFYSAGYSAGLAFASGARASIGGSGLAGSIAAAFHRARGGSIWKRRGTDTVPAMLTPGEYVMQRKAVSTFGRDFMRRVNALDIKGAMASLAMRGGAHILGARGMSINNSRTVTKTNNAKVTQNIYTNNANFAYRRANRWVGAL